VDTKTCLRLLQEEDLVEWWQSLIKVRMFIYLFIINFVKRQGCTEGQACNRTPHTHTYTTKKC